METPQEETPIAATPDGGELQAPAQNGKGQQEEVGTVQISKKEYEQLQMNKNLATNLQKKVERLSRNAPAIQQQPAQPVFSLEEEVQPEVVAAQNATAAQQAEVTRFKEMLSETLIDNPSYQSLLSRNNTIRRVLRNDPMALLSSEEASQLRFAEDAVAKVTAYLDQEILQEKSTEKQGDAPKGAEIAPVPTNPVSRDVPKPASGSYDEGKAVGGVKGVEQMLRERINVNIK